MPDRNMKAEGWSFSRTPDGWVWHFAGSVHVASRRSDRAFSSFLDCMNDAAAHGYNRHVGERGEANQRAGGQ